MSGDLKEFAIFTANEDYEPYDPAWPEKSLLRAILVTAMNDVKKSGDVKRQATEFFLSPEEDYIFSFRAICDYLNVDADRILVITGLSGYSVEDSAVLDTGSKIVKQL